MSTQTSDGDWIIPESVADTFTSIANAFYVLFGLLFVGGLYFDWRHPGAVVVSPFAVVQDPYSNSGLFITAIIILLIGYLFGKSADYIEEKNKKEFDQTQEWTVDIRGLSTNSQNDG